jgi:cytochrome P450
MLVLSGVLPVLLNKTRKYSMLQMISSLQDVQNLYNWFAQMRDAHPVWLDESSGCWHVFRYDDVLQVTTDHHRFSSKRPRVLRRTFDARGDLVDSLIGMDPPQHHLYRNLAAPAFTSRVLAPLSGRISSIVQCLLDQVRSSGRMDMVADLAYPLPTTVIAELLGVPTSDRPMFKRWADTLFSRQLSDAELFKTADPQEMESIQRSNAVTQEMADYFRRLLEERRQRLRNDLMSELLAAQVDGEHLSTDQVISFCILLLLAGHVTTTNLLCQAILCFDDYPATMRQLCQHPELIANAIEEVLRYASPVWRLIRVTTKEVIIDGTTIPANAVVFAWLASANRDGAQFRNPEHFDITRSPNPHVAFGHGIHFCLGAPLARLEARIALPMMLEQLPELHRIREIPLEFLDSRSLFGVKQLPVAFVPNPVQHKTFGWV